MSVGDKFVCCIPKKSAVGDGQIFGFGTIGSIDDVGDGHVRAVYSDYTPVDPALPFEAVGGDPRPNVQNSINRVPSQFFLEVQNAVTAGDQDSSSAEHLWGLPEMELTSDEGVRSAFADLVGLDLLGPANGEEEELLYDSPQVRYVVGTLAPRHTANPCLLYTSPSPRDQRGSRMPSSA